MKGKGLAFVLLLVWMALGTLAFGLVQSLYT
jgi:hypothetical protein